MIATHTRAAPRTGALPPALSLVAQIRIAAAGTSDERIQRVRDRLLMPRNCTEARTLPLRRALLELLAHGGELDINTLRARLPADIEHSHESARRQLALLQQFGWAESRCTTSRRGMTVGSPRARFYTINAAGRTALADAATAATASTTGDH